jgi:hypothetical protein
VILKNPFSFTRNVRCNGEFAPVSGVAHILFHVTEDASGGFHTDFKINEHAAGTGLTTGANYEFQFIDNNSVNMRSLPSDMTLTVSEHVIGQGSVPNFLLYITLHITVNAEGRGTATVDNFNTECH